MDAETKPRKKLISAAQPASLFLKYTEQHFWHNGLTCRRRLRSFAHPLVWITPFPARRKLCNINVVRWRLYYRRSRRMHMCVLVWTVRNLSRRWVIHGRRNSIRGSQTISTPVLSRGAIWRPPAPRRLWVRIHVWHMMVSSKVGVLWCWNKILWRQIDAWSSYRPLVIHAAFFIQ